MRKINKIIIHHTESKGGDREFIRYLHVDRNKWSDIGYHYLITNGKKNGEWKAGKDGEIQEGRPVEKMGAHARGSNKGSIGVSLIGTFMKTEPTPLQIASLIRLVTELCQKYNLNPLEDILAHRDVGKTDCPGDNLYKLLPIIKTVIHMNVELQRAIEKYLLK